MEDEINNRSSAFADNSKTNRIHRRIDLSPIMEKHELCEDFLKTKSERKLKSINPLFFRNSSKIQLISTKETFDSKAKQEKDIDRFSIMSSGSQKEACNGFNFHSLRKIRKVPQKNAKTFENQKEIKSQNKEGYMHPQSKKVFRLNSKDVFKASQQKPINTFLFKKNEKNKNPNKKSRFQIKKIQRLSFKNKGKFDLNGRMFKSFIFPPKPQFLTRQSSPTKSTFLNRKKSKKSKKLNNFLLLSEHFTHRSSVEKFKSLCNSNEKHYRKQSSGNFSKISQYLKNKIKTQKTNKIKKANTRNINFKNLKNYSKSPSTISRTKNNNPASHKLTAKMFQKNKKKFQANLTDNTQFYSVLNNKKNFKKKKPRNLSKTPQSSDFQNSCQSNFNVIIPNSFSRNKKVQLRNSLDRLSNTYC